MPFRILLFVLLLFGASPLCTQSPSLDSLRTLFYRTADDSLRRELSEQLVAAFSFVQVDSALIWAERGHVAAQRLEDPDSIGKSLYQLGTAHRYKQNFAQAMEHFLAAMRLFEEIGNEKMRIDTEYEISVIYRLQEDFQNAKKYLDRFYQYYLEREDPASIIFALNEYNVLYELMGKPDSMLYYAKETLRAARQYKQTRYLAKIHNNLAATYLYQENFADAKIHFEAAEEIGFGDDVSGRYFNNYARADMYRLLGQLDSSVIFAKAALEIAQSFGDLARESQMHQFLSDVYVEQGNYQQAYDALKTFTLLEDSVTVMQHEQNLSELSVQYETQQKEAQITQQQLALEREANRRNLILFGAALLLLAVGSTFLYWRNRQRNRQQQAELELQLKATEAKRLRELDELKSNFFANISHEFRTPLTLILTPLREMVKGAFKGNAQEYYHMMIRNGDRLLGLVNQLLELSQLESGRLQLEPRAADLTKFVRSVVFSFESWAMRKQIFFQTRFPRDEIIAQFDSDKLEKIVSNLLSNAFKFTPEKGRVTVDMTVVQQGNEQIELKISVENTGKGIPSEELPHIFDRFYSQPQESVAMQSSGIGLALTKELVELQGGTIQAASEPHQRTVFTFTLPLLLAKAATTALALPPPAAVFAEAEAPEMPQTTNSRHPIVLLVEDNPDLRVYLKEQLVNHYQILEAVHGKQGLDLAIAHIPDLVLTDVMMPEMNGMELCQMLKTDERTSHVPVVMLTARSDQQDKISGLSTGADAYLTKPFDAEELQIVVHNLIEQRRKLREKFAADFGASPATAPPLDFVSPAEDAFLKKVTAAVKARLDDENFSIENLGKAVGMSRSQLHRKLKAITDQSPSVFVRTLRLQHAYHLLQQRAGNISEVAFQVGIPNLAYFSRSFSEQYGFPPSTLLHEGES